MLTAVPGDETERKAIIATVKIEIVNRRRTYNFKFDDVRQLFDFEKDKAKVTCPDCGFYCGGIGALIKHLADNCSESSSVGAFLKRLDS